MKLQSNSNYHPQLNIYYRDKWCLQIPLKFSLHCYIICFSYTLSRKNVPLIKCNFGSLLERILHFHCQNSNHVCNRYLRQMGSRHVSVIFKTTLTRYLCHRELNRTSGCVICLVQSLGLESNLAFLLFISPCFTKPFRLQNKEYI